MLFAVSPLRLRLLPPTLLAAGLTRSAYRPLTRPFRSANETALVGDVRHTGTTILVLGAIGVALGLAYSVVDRRLELGARARRLAGVVVGVLAAAAIVAGTVVVLERVDLGSTSGAPSRTPPRTRPRATCSSSARTATTSGAWR